MYEKQDLVLELVEVAINRRTSRRDVINALNSYEQLCEEEKQASISLIKALNSGEEPFLSAEETVKLKDIFFDIWGQNSLVRATEYGFKDVVHLLLTDSRIEQNYQIYEALRAAFTSDDADMVQLYWDYSKVGHDSEIYRQGCDLTSPDVMSMLLAKPEVNPYPSLTEAIINRGREHFLGVGGVVQVMSCLKEYGFTADMVKLYLKGELPRFNVMGERHAKIFSAIINELLHLDCMSKEVLVELLNRVELLNESHPKLLETLKDIGLFQGTDRAILAKDFFTLVQDDSVQPLLAYVIEKGLMSQGIYELYLVSSLNPEQLERNTLLITQDPPALYHFDGDGNQTVVLDQAGIIALGIDSQLKRALKPGERIDLFSILDVKKYNEVFVEASQRGCVLSWNYRREIYSLLVSSLGFSSDILTALERFDSVNLLLPAFFKAVCENASFVSHLNAVFNHMNELACLTKDNVALVFKQVKQIAMIKNGLHRLYIISTTGVQVRSSTTIGLICQYPEHSDALNSIFYFLASRPSSLLTEENLGLLISNIQFSQGILTACYSLAVNRVLNQRNFNLLMQSPASAIYQAIKLRGKFVYDEDGFREFKDLHQAARIMGEMYRGGRFPLEIGKRISAEVNNHYFDEQTVQEIEKCSMNKPS